MSTTTVTTDIATGIIGVLDHEPPTSLESLLGIGCGILQIRARTRLELVDFVEDVPSVKFIHSYFRLQFSKIEPEPETQTRNRKPKTTENEKSKIVKTNVFPCVKIVLFV